MTVSPAPARPLPSPAWRRAERPVLLTFDDGPDADVTPRVLETLAKHDVLAIFFMLGARLADSRLRAVALDVQRAGHTIGHHGVSHRQLTTLDDETLARELTETDPELHGKAPVLMRPPFGTWDLRVLRAAAARQQVGLLWNVDTQDWRHAATASGDGWVEEGLAQASHLPNAVVLLHDVHATTAQHLDLFLRRLREDHGATFPPLFDPGDPSPEPPASFLPSGDEWTPGPYDGAVWRDLLYLPSTLIARGASTDTLSSVAR